MKKLLILASFFAFVFAVAPGAAHAAQNAIVTKTEMAVTAPLVDTFEDGDHQLRLVGLPTPEGDRLQVTLIYQDAERQAQRSITIDPALATTTQAPELTEFLQEMEPGFLSYVRATLADRLMHLKTAPNGFERAVSTVFFPRVKHDGRVAQNATESEGKAE